ncbi:hypothetical protein OSB04_015006 [Centaurea solstitialis]|uniref:PGG domain-containing protein n=1 Tax=Centaurea solstitialis TaxID=347529 RepID=A0AA38T9C7_9ASTR|nr:hypothetical protein OSB04_015006 [Centaurea solstitialis]
MASGPPNPPPHLSLPREDLYIHASSTNVSSFVSMKLSGHDNYDHWKAQMLCLMETHNMCGLVDPRFDRSLSTEIMKQHDDLLKGWIFDSVSHGVLGTVADLDSAKLVWNKLKALYDSTICFQQDLAQEKQEEKEEIKDKGISTETDSKGKDIVSEEKEVKGKGISTETDSKGNDSVSEERKTKKDQSVIDVEDPRRMYSKPPPLTPKEKVKQREDAHKSLEKDTLKGFWWGVHNTLVSHNIPLQEEINNERNTVLHLAVEKGHNNFVKSLLGYQKEDEIKEALEIRNVDGSTALHVAAILGNTNVAQLLLEKHNELLTTLGKQEKHNELLTILDHEGRDPLFKAYSSMQFETCIYLLTAVKNKQNSTIPSSFMTTGVDLLVNAISAKKYSIALNFVKQFPEFARENDQVLMAIARSFPSGLSHEETVRRYEDLGEVGMLILRTIVWSFSEFTLRWCQEGEFGRCHGISRIDEVPLRLVQWVYQFIFFLMSIVFLPLFMIHLLLREGAIKLVSYMNRIKKKEWGEAKEVLKLVCDGIKTLKVVGTHHPYYKGPLLEAACQNAYEVVNEILSKSPQALRCKDEYGHDIIQLAVIHRSDKIYNRVYQSEEGKSQYYRTIRDPLDNNMLHLAGRLAPSHELNRITGAALQLQRELQWREELKKFVFPSYITQENKCKKTPGEVFTKEHEDLVKEGEKWMKTTAESCSITAGLITTIVFAASITVPGGSNQEKGVPLFTHEIAFIIFAISDAISLFTSTITLLVFLSILTARFSEQDFLVSLPRRLIIGLCALLVSTTAMIVAFGAILFLVFCHQRPWMLIPICASVCLTVVFFFIIQFPLIIDLYRSTYVPIFVKRGNSQESRFTLDNFVSEFFFFE